jgi:uncharacterized hydrophobic protein (TIGR00271 family)
MLQLRVYGEAPTIETVAERLGTLRGVRHLTVVAGTGSGVGSVVAADVRADVADAALSLLGRLGVPADDIVLTRLDTIASAPDSTEAVALVWADMLGRAREQVRAPARYFVLMAAAGVIAAFAVINTSSVLIVGAMAISPDLLPIVAACTGVVLLRGRLVRRGLGTLAVGLLVTGATAAAVTGILRLFDWLPGGFSLGDIPAAQTHIGISTVFVALAAGVAGMVAMETRASSAVGVAISVTTIPAAAYLGVALGVGSLDKSLSALWVLLANVALMMAGGSAALAVQRSIAGRTGVPS